MYIECKEITLSAQEFSALKLKDISNGNDPHAIKCGFSELVQYQGKQFTWYVTNEPIYSNHNGILTFHPPFLIEVYKVTMIGQSILPPFGLPVALRSVDLKSLGIQPDGTSTRVDLQDSFFTVALERIDLEFGEKIYKVIRHQKKVGVS
jgi:hypothetical protein